MEERTDVLVIGAGPTGLTLGLELLARGVACRVIDKAPVASDKSRALAVQARTLEHLAKRGAARELVARGREGMHVELFVRRRKAFEAELGDIGADDTQYPFLLFISQAETEDVLRQHLEREGGRVERGVEATALRVDEDGVVVELRRNDSIEKVRARYVVGCDGAHSMVRKSAGLRFEGGAYEQDFVLADVAIDWDMPEGHLAFFLGDEGLLVAFPFREPGFHRLIATRTSGKATDAEPTLPELQTLLDRMSPVAARLRDPRWIARFRLHHRGVDRYREGRLFVAGDAAHIHSPAGGQGMNTGIQDAVNLGWKLALVVAGRAPEALLDSYHAERHPVGQRLLSFTDRLFTFASSRSRLLVALRNALAPVVIPQVLGRDALRRRAFRFVSQLAIKYPQSPIVAERIEGANATFREGPRAGARAPDGPVAGGGMLLDRLGGTSHHLLVFGGPKAGAVTAPETMLAALTARGAEFAAVHRIIGHAPPNGNQGALVDESGVLHRRYGLEGPGHYLVRPDGYIAFRAPGLEPGALADYLNRMYPR
ncbi:2-polyprenyl-6-methoxyphenol hydroxylase [Minicystis rosea]|nr:2-polyprenyl-6-methoxyphenol hydroxylase [Minicystis rosea]